jgi:hypothetical protein
MFGTRKSLELTGWPLIDILRFMLLHNDTVSNSIERFGIYDVVNSDERKKIGILFSSIYLLVKYLLVKSLMFYQLWLALRLEEMNKTVGKIQIR